MLNEQQSEMLGILFGDGSLSRTHSSVQIAITGNKHDDRDYLLERVRPMFEQLFGRRPRVRWRRHENTMDFYIYSGRITSTLHGWGMPYGLKKAHDLKPSLALRERAFIRGYFDTDGCVYRKYATYLQVQFKSASESLMMYVRDVLKLLGFHPTAIVRDETKFRFFLCRQQEVRLFFETVRPANPKHLQRFRRLSETLP